MDSVKTTCVMNLQNENQMHVISLKTGWYEGVNRADPVPPGVVLLQDNQQLRGQRSARLGAAAAGSLGRVATS